jgi:hypothetical protein
VETTGRREEKVGRRVKEAGREEGAREERIPVDTSKSEGLDVGEGALDASDDQRDAKDVPLDGPGSQEQGLEVTSCGGSQKI